jgi:hypothetical protein
MISGPFLFFEISYILKFQDPYNLELFFFLSNMNIYFKKKTIRDYYNRTKKHV